MKNSIKWAINCPLFSGLSESELAGLLEKTAARLRSYSKEDLVAQAGDEVHFLHILVSGSVRGEMIDYAGKVIKIEDIHPPKPLATAFLFGKQNQYPVNITANVETSLISIPREDVLRLMQMNQLVLKNFLNSISSRSQFLSSKIRFLSFSTIKGKLSHYLLNLIGETGRHELVLPHSQNQLAELFGVARPSVGRAISELNQEGLIRTSGKKVEILDRPGLEDLLG